MIAPDLLVVLFGLASAASWGAGDFSGGLASRRTSALGVVVVSQAIGFGLAVLLGLGRGEPAPGPDDVVWAAAAGIAGSIGLAAFYRGLAIGRMGAVAPIAGVLAAAIPVVAAAVLEGLPRELQLAGIALAMVSVVLVSTSTDGGGSVRPSLGLALLAGTGFGLFFVLIDRVGEASLFWPLAAARAASVGLMLSLVLVGRRSWRPTRSAWGLVVAAGILDMGGNTMFLAASQVGRLDIAAVLSSLYPVGTILLAALVLRERIERIQAVGIALAIVAIALIAAG